MHTSRNHYNPYDEEVPRLQIAAEREAPYNLKGRGAQINTFNPFSRQQVWLDHVDSYHEEEQGPGPATIFQYESAKRLINKVESPDIPAPYSMNPYQGCEHGCVYCYARTTHQYWGYSAGLDFERRIIIKENAAELLEKELRSPRWVPGTIMLSGNTDCYQPVERKLNMTAKLLGILRDFRNPVGIITKNALVTRDLGVLSEMASMRLAQVSISITAGSDSLRRSMEPRSSTVHSRLAAIERLTRAGIPVNAMIAPVIPGLNSEEVPEMLRMASDAGAVSAGYQLVRLNGPVANIFEDWLQRNYPDRASKVLALIKDSHGGITSDSRFSTRMKGEGAYAQSLLRLFKLARQRYFGGKSLPELDTSLFRLPSKGGQLSLF